MSLPSKDVVAPVRRAAVIFVFITVLLDVLALGIIIPVLPSLVKDFVQNDTVRAARVYGLFGTAWALMQFIFSPVLGALSDRFGRRPVILLSNLGMGLDSVLMASAGSLPWLFVGRVLSGITGASISTAYSYIADVVVPEKRAASFGILGMAFGLGFVLGPAVGGLLGHENPRLPFWVAASLSFANAVYGFFVLPESLSKDKRAPFRWARANPVGALRLLRSHPNLTGLSMVGFLTTLAHVVLPSVFVLYAEHRYGWTTRMVGQTLSVVGVCSAIVQAGVLRFVVGRLGERTTLLVGFACGTVGFAIYGLAPTGNWFWAGIPFTALWGLSGPSVQGLMTRLVSPSEQGQLQGAYSSLAGISGLVGPELFTSTLALALGPWADLQLPGAPFLLAALLLAVAGVVGYWVAPVTPKAQVSATPAP